MQSVTKSQIEKWPVGQYEEFRRIAQNGDIVFCSGKGGLLGRLIRGFTNSPWTHVGMLLWWDNRLMMVHSAENGVQFYPFSKYVEEYEGALVVARYLNMPDDGPEKLPQIAAEYLNRKYDKWELVRIAWRIGWGIPRKPRPNDAFICSELVAHLLASVGCHIQPDKRGFTSPENIWVDPFVLDLVRVR